MERGPQRFRAHREPMPSLEVALVDLSNTRARIRCEPLSPGLATVLGMLLRRTVRALHVGADDASFPVRRVDFTVTRLRARLQGESLELDVLTDGTIDPVHAVSRGTRLIEAQVELVMDGPTHASSDEAPASPDMEDMHDVMQVMRIVERTESAFVASRAGQTSLTAIVGVLAELRLALTRSRAEA